jgi:hypothetical protein
MSLENEFLVLQSGLDTRPDGWLLTGECETNWGEYRTGERETAR